MIKELFEGQERGECRGDYEHFKFNSKSDPTTKAMCQRCVVREACLWYGVRHESYGIWGGLNEDDRKLVRKASGILVPPLLGYEKPLQVVSVYLNRERSSKRMKEMKWRRAEQLQ